MTIRTDADLAAILDEPRSYFQKDGQKYYDRQTVLDLMGQVAATMKRQVANKGDQLGGITTPLMEGDNLAIVLCSHFDNPNQEEDDETHWTPDAESGCNEVIAAIRRHYETP